MCAQYARPISTIANDGFTPVGAATLWEAIDETTPEIADYIYTPITSKANFCEIRLSSLEDPLSDSEHCVRYLIRAAVNPGPIVVVLYQGSTIITMWTEMPGTASPVACEHILLAEEAALITDYTDLRLRFLCVGTAFYRLACIVYWAEMEVPEFVALPFGPNYYGSVQEAVQYFVQRLHEYAWSKAKPTNRPKALWAATQIIDTLNFKGCKNSVYKLGSAATSEQIREAEAEQALEFPRDADVEVPEAIRWACYEIAHALLDGKDPDQELENLGITSQGHSSVRTMYNRKKIPIEHIINGVPSPTAWHLLKPFLRDDDAIKLARVT